MRSQRAMRGLFVFLMMGCLVVTLGVQASQYERVILVRSEKELLQSIGPNRMLLLQPKEYRLTVDMLKGVKNPYVEWVASRGEFRLRNLKNFKMEGTGEAPVKWMMAPGLANGFTFVNCSGITITHLEIGQLVEQPEDYWGSPLVFKNCREVQVEKSVLSGEHRAGLILDQVAGLTCNDCVIQNCSFSMLWIGNSKEIRFQKTTFENNRGLEDLINMVDSAGIFLEGCVIRESLTPEGALFGNERSTGVRVKDTSLVDNRAQYLLFGDPVEFDHLKLAGNSFQMKDIKTVHRPKPTPTPTLEAGPSPGKATPTRTQGRLAPQVIRVKDERELLLAIGPDRTLLLEPKLYDLKVVAPQGLPGEKVIKSPYFRWRSEGSLLAFRNLQNLKLEGLGARPVKIISDDPWDFVLGFEKSSGIRLVNVEVGHAPDLGECDGGVLRFSNCEDIGIEGSVLYGCGSEGLRLSWVTGFRFADSVIRDCTSGIMSLEFSDQLVFEKAVFQNNREFYMINLKYCREVLFAGCAIRDNVTNPDFRAAGVFDLDHCIQVAVQDSVITNNQAKYFLKGHPIETRNLTLEGNSFGLKDQLLDPDLYPPVTATPAPTSRPGSVTPSGRPTPSAPRTKASTPTQAPTPTPVIPKTNPFAGFTRTRWGMSRAEIKGLGLGRLVADDPEGLTVAGWFLELPCMIRYSFHRNGKLLGVGYRIRGRYPEAERGALTEMDWYVELLSQFYGEADFGKSADNGLPFWTWEEPERELGVMLQLDWDDAKLLWVRFDYMGE